MDNQLQARGTAFKKANPEQARQYTSNAPKKEYVVNRTADNTPNYNSRIGGRTQNKIDAEDARIKRKVEEEERARKSTTGHWGSMGSFYNNGYSPTKEVLNEGAAKVRDKIGSFFEFINPTKLAYLDMGQTSPFVYSDFDQKEVKKGRQEFKEAADVVQSYALPSTYARKFIPEEWQENNAVLDLLLLGMDIGLGGKFTKGVGKATKYVTSPIHGKWTTFDFLNRGPREYRLQFGPKANPNEVALGSNYLVHGESKLPQLRVIEELPENLERVGWVDNGNGTFTNKQGKTGVLIKTNNGTKFLDVSLIHNRPAEYQNVITDKVKEQADYYTGSSEASVSHPLLVRQINDDPALGDMLSNISSKEKANAPRIIDNGVEPNAMTIALINKAIKEGKYSPDQLFEITYRGDQPIIRSIGRKRNNSWGGYNYSSDQLGNAINYAAHGGPQTQMRFLRELGFREGTPQWDYAMEKFNIINKLQEQYKFKNGKYKNKENPKSNRLNSYGTYDRNMSYEQISEKMTPEDRIAYENAAREISEFFGAGEEAFDFGGVHQQAIALPDFGKRGTVEMEIPSHYENLGYGKVYMGPEYQGNVQTLFKPAVKDGQTLNTIGSVSRGFNEAGIPYFQVKNVLDPQLGTTIAVDPWYVIPGLKKGGRINITAGKFH